MCSKGTNIVSPWNWPEVRLNISRNSTLLLLPDLQFIKILFPKEMPLPLRKALAAFKALNNCWSISFFLCFVSLLVFQQCWFCLAFLINLLYFSSVTGKIGHCGMASEPNHYTQFYICGISNFEFQIQELQTSFWNASHLQPGEFLCSSKFSKILTKSSAGRLPKYILNILYLCTFFWDWQTPNGLMQR